MALFCRRKGCLAIAYYRLCGRLFSSAAAASSSSSAPPLPSLRPPPVVASLHTPPALRLSITMMRSPSALAMLAAPFLARNCTSTAYRPPTPPGEFEGGEGDGEADGADVSGDGSGDANALPDGAGDVNTPPESMYDDSIYDDDGECEEEDLPPDPEESCLYSPSDSD